MMPSSCRYRMGFSLWAVASLVCATGCFGTGVVNSSIAASAQTEGSVHLADAILSPPAPTMTRLALTNNAAGDVTITGVQLPPEANVQLDTSGCPGYPTLASHTGCNVVLGADGSARPGQYDISVTYSHAGQSKVVGAQLTITSAPLRINDGAGIGMPDQVTQVPVSIVNDGFDLGDVNVVVTCPQSTNGQPAVCVSDASACSQGLLANASCMLVLTSAGVIYGASGSVQAGHASDATLSAQPIRTASLTANNLTFAQPQTQPITLVNHGNLPISVTSVSLGGRFITGFTLPPGLGAHPTACQQFLGTCQLPLTARPDVYVDGGLAVLSVNYHDDIMTHTAASTVSVTATAHAVCSASSIALPSSISQQVITATNTGVLDWRGARVSLQPPLRGVTVRTTCQGTVPPNSSFTVTLTTDNTTDEGATAQLMLTGENLPAALAIPVEVERSLLAVGSSASWTLAADVSYDGGHHWMLVPLSDSGQWQASVLTHDVWLTVGQTQNVQSVYTSQDRGHSWLQANLGPSPSGTLNGVTQLASTDLLIAVGVDANMAPAAAAFRTSTDMGVTWTGSQRITPGSGAAYGVASNAVAAVAVGTAAGSCFAASSNDANNPTWDLFISPGTLYGVATDGQTWIAVGQDGSGGIMALRNPTKSADVLGWSSVALSSGSNSGTLYSVANQGSVWVAVGTDGNAQHIVMSTDGGQTFSVQALGLGQGYLNAVQYDGHVWVATGFDTTQNVPVVLGSADGLTWTEIERLSDGSLVGLSTR